LLYQLSFPFIGGLSGLSAFLPIYRWSLRFISFPSHLSAVTPVYQLSFPFISNPHLLVTHIKTAPHCTQDKKKSRTTSTLLFCNTP
ncbi:hypothetical protein, partial [Oceanobacillus senegalensis]|uniref:hypothetical protein n=1 Tax=Oceanobacillus senegalensis TaxID=1936063 RepID=UPI001C4F121D